MLEPARPEIKISWTGVRQVAAGINHFFLEGEFLVDQEYAKRTQNGLACQPRATWRSAAL